MSMSSDVMYPEAGDLRPQTQLADRRAWGPYTDVDDRESIIEQIFERISRGETLTGVCANRDMPSVSTLFRWIADDETKWAEYRRAREVQAHVFASRVVDVVYEPLDPATMKVRIDALKWSAGRGAPKDFGDSTQLRHADADGNKLDTAPLVAELLSILPGGVQPAAPKPGAVSARLVRESSLEPPSPTQSAARPAYRPRGLRDDCEDLV